MTIKTFDGIGTVGVVSDVPHFALPHAAWTNANNVRFLGSRVEKMQGFKLTYDYRFFDQNSNDNKFIIDMIRSSYPSRGKFYDEIIVGTESDLYSVKSAKYTESITRQTGGKYDANLTNARWRFCKLSDSIIAVNRNDVPQGRPFGTNIGQVTSDFEDLPNWGKTFVGEANETSEYWRTAIMAPFKNFLVALGTSEGVDEANAYDYNQRVRWSDIVPVNELPSNWDAASLTGSSGYVDLTGATGSIVDGAPLGDGFLIYTTQEVYMMQYVGGNDIFTFRKLFPDFGALTTGSVASFDNKHFVVGDNDIYVTNGQSYDSIADGRVKEKLFGDIHKGNEPQWIKTEVDETNKEIMILFRKKSASGVAGADTAREADLNGSYDTAAVWNWEYNTWTFRELPNATCAKYVPNVEADIAGLWRDYPIPWNDPSVNLLKWRNQDAISASFSSMAIGTTLGGLWRMDVDGKIPVRVDLTQDPLVPTEVSLYCILRRDNINFHEEQAPPDFYKKVKYVYPLFTGGGTVSISLGESDVPAKIGSFAPTQTQSFDISSDYKADFRTNSRYLSINISDDAGDSPWQLSSLSIDYEIGGQK